MAIYNEILAPRYARKLQKLFGIKGSVPAKQLGGEISAVLPLFNGRENRHLEDWQMFGSHTVANGVAAQDSVIRLSNPAGSNIVAVIEGYKLWFNAAGETFVEFAATGNNGALVGGTVSPVAFDSRRLPPGTGNNQAALVSSFANNIGQGNHIVFDDIILPINTLTNEQVNFDSQEIPILPGADLQFRTVTLNIQMIVSVRWRERFLEESERQ